MKRMKPTLQHPPPHLYLPSTPGQPAKFIHNTSPQSDHMHAHPRRNKVTTAAFICPLRKHRAGVDIHSCSQFLLELYSQWLIPGSPNNRRTPTILISEVVRSVSSVTHPLLISLVYINMEAVHCSLETLLYLCRSRPPALFFVAAGSVGPVHREEPV